VSCRRTRYASERIGLGCDFENIIDLMGYLLPRPMMQRWRHRSIVLESGDASRIICSSLIVDSRTGRREVAEIPHHFMRRATFSPYFIVVKPTRARLEL